MNNRRAKHGLKSNVVLSLLQEIHCTCEVLNPPANKKIFVLKIAHELFFARNYVFSLGC